MKSIYLYITALALAIFIADGVYADTTYVIKKGDTPYDLARKFRVSSREIIRANNLNPKSLRPGTKITIPSKGRHVALKGVKKKVGNAAHAEEKDRKEAHDIDHAAGVPAEALLHVIKRGDTLSSISKKYAVSVNELKEMNNLRTTRLKTGGKLIVRRTTPAKYTVRKGDTIWDIAKRFDLDPDELMEINSLETDFLKPGQMILLSAAQETKDPQTYDAILSRAHMEKELEKMAESKEISDLGMQDRLILFAKKLLNIPYRFGGNSFFGIDCSAYVKKVYSLIGINLPRSAREQFQEGTPVSPEELSIGDLVFFKTYASFPSHVGIYLGNNLFIHASSKGKKVTINSLDTPYYLKRFIGAKRLLDLPDPKDDGLQKDG